MSMDPRPLAASVMMRVLVAGAFAGAALGAEAFPSGWRERIEYADRLEAVAAGLAERRT